MEWTYEVDDSYSAEEGNYTAVVYHDYDGTDDEENNWAYRVESREDQYAESGPCDSPEDGQRICESLIREATK